MDAPSLFRRLCIAACAVAATAAWADPPGRVGRITYIEGDVSFYNDPDDGWRKAQINYPVTGENSLWTEGNARAEVRIGPSAIRIGDDAVFDFVKLQDDLALGYLQRGSLNVRIRQFGSLDAADRLQIDTSEGRFILEGNGRYRLDVSAAGGESRISVFSGSARFEGVNREDARLSIDAGKRLTVRTTGGMTDLRFDSASESPFDRWAENRDQQWDQTHTRFARDNTRETLISPYMTGYEDLDTAGDWIDDNQYGRLWTPRVIVANWAPYRYGRWSYVRPWGWTWIDDAPWGFAPFHYGRWVQLRSRWCWWPGPYIGRPVYAPALVAWFGSQGSGLTISSGPAVGWFPLAPREYYVPRYGNSPGYLRRINYVTNNITIINPPTQYRNQVPGATIVANNVFVNGHPVGSNVAPVPPAVLAGRAPIASFDMPRPVRNPVPQMPGRRQDGQPVVPPPVPRPRFASDTPPPVSRGQLPSVPGEPTPKFRTPVAAHTGPLPVQKAMSAPAQGGAFQGPASVATVPAAQPKPRPQPVYTPLQPGAAATTAPIQVEAAPVMPDRDARQPRARNAGRPQSDVPYQSAPPPIAQPMAAPAIVPRPSIPPRQPAPQETGQTHVKPAPVHTTKPSPDAQDESGKGDKNDGRGKPRTAKE